MVASPPHMDGIVSILYNGPPFPSKLPIQLEMWTASETQFLGPTRVHNPNGISIGSAVFAGLTIVTDRPTDDDILRL